MKYRRGKNQDIGSEDGIEFRTYVYSTGAVEETTVWPPDSRYRVKSCRFSRPLIAIFLNVLNLLYF
jgi:hypothetical protein